MTTLNPYLGFRDQARDALTFYHSVFGGDLTISTFAEFHASEDPSEADNVMHGQLEGPGGLVLMASDTPKSMAYTPGSAHSVSLSGGAADQAELTRFWEGLSDGATITMPLAVAPWGDTFGMLVDKFGVSWLVNITTS
ncbi:VOC family protein [Cellulomonas edaphi]|uniref:VOC family protein n=1 Tax=Cellulomonas edaphi TaxID=3053468 RepID=A0ABT7S464_9CELL|nr:VOC family protein [Cellulomons edaphi]MDM7830414.1 VOC family protein [Cellulomons edaphi]